MSVSAELRNARGRKAGSVELPAEIFDVQANIPLMHLVVVAQLNAARQGTHKTKTRGEVAGGGRKPYKQKGTGRARQGSIRAPQFTGGGVVHGPVPRDYSQRVNKKMKVAALRGALSDRAREGLVHVVESFITGDTPRTKDALAVLSAITDARRVLVVLDSDDVNSWLSLRNLPNVHLLDAGQLNTYDVLLSDAVVFSRAGLDQFLGEPAQYTETEVEDDDDEDEAPAAVAVDADEDSADADEADEADSDEEDTDEEEAEK